MYRSKPYRRFLGRPTSNLLTERGEREYSAMNAVLVHRREIRNPMGSELTAIVIDPTIPHLSLQTKCCRGTSCVVIKPLIAEILVPGWFHILTGDEESTNTPSAANNGRHSKE